MFWPFKSPFLLPNTLDKHSLTQMHTHIHTHIPDYTHTSKHTERQTQAHKPQTHTHVTLTHKIHLLILAHTYTHNKAHTLSFTNTQCLSHAYTPLSLSHTHTHTQVQCKRNLWLWRSREQMQLSVASSIDSINWTLFLDSLRKTNSEQFRPNILWGLYLTGGYCTCSPQEMLSFYLCFAFFLKTIL